MNPSDITLVTATADQPTGIAFCEAFMRAQTVDVGRMRWIVVDDGEVPATLTMDQTYIRRTREADCLPGESFCRNMLAALDYARSPYLIFIEHDDAYLPPHLETMLELFDRPGTTIAGNGPQRYYNVQQRCWRAFENHGACLCQTGIHARALPTLREVLAAQLRTGTYGVDGHLWRRIPPRQWALTNTGTVLGIKGLPGRAGLGLGHRPTVDWSTDPELAMLRAWIGDVADLYAPFYAPTPLPLTPPRPLRRALPSAEPRP